jgi:hypothetical protein
MDVLIVLGKLAHDSQVFLDGVEVSDACTGLELRAHVGELTQLTLHLMARVEIYGELGQLQFKKPGDEPL